MPKPIHEMSSWGASAHPSHVPKEELDQAWQATRQQVGAATQVMTNRDDYLASTSKDVGRQIGRSQWELFVVCEPGDAMQQQFESLSPEFAVLHDVGTQSSRRMLAGLATAMRVPVHQLHIRRQGLGVALAHLEFVELPVAAGTGHPLRLYTTETDADTTQRRRLARMLLAYSRLGVVMVGDLPPHALATALLPLREAIVEGPWLNRQLLMLPLAGASTVAKQAASIAGSSQVQVRTTPLVTRPAEAWGYLKASWNRMREQLADEAIHIPEIIDPQAPAAPAAATTSTVAGARPATTTPAAPAVSPVQTAPGATSPAPASAATAAAPASAPARTPLPMQPMPLPGALNGAPAIDAALATYLRRCGELKGMVSCCIFELASQRTLGHVGARPGPAALASHGASLMASMAEAAHALNLGDAAPDAAVTFANHHELLRAVPARRGLAMHAVLDKAQSNLALVRLQLQRLDLLLEEGAVD